MSKRKKTSERRVENLRAQQKRGKEVIWVVSFGILTERHKKG